MLGSIGGITTADELEVFLLGAISILPASRVGGEWQRGFGSEKARTRARKAKAAKSAALMGYSRARYRFKKCPVSTQRTTWSSGSYFQKTGAPPHHSAIILKVAHVACYHSALPPKRRFRIQSLGITSKISTSPSSHSALPLKRRFRVQSLGITSKTSTSPSSQSALPLKCWYSDQLLGVASETPTSPSSYSALPLKS
jgi:hypothetical protein